MRKNFSSYFLIHCTVSHCIDCKYRKVLEDWTERPKSPLFIMVSNDCWSPQSSSAVLSLYFKDTQGFGYYGETKLENESSRTHKNAVRPPLKGATELEESVFKGAEGPDGR